MELQQHDDEAGFEEIENEGVKNVKRCLQKLYYIWEEFGIDKIKKSHRAKSVWVHILNLVKDILEEEASLHKETLDRIEDYKMKISELTSILGVTPKEMKETSLIKKEEFLCRELENFRELKNKQIKIYQDLKNSELIYCEILNFPGHKLIHDSGIPTEKDIVEIKNHIEMLKEEKQKRLKRFSAMKRELKTIWEETELSPETSIEKEIFSSKETFSLSNETFHSLEQVIGKVQHKRSELEDQKNNLLKKLTALWQRLQIDENERKEFLSRHADCRISTLKSIEQEIERCNIIKMTKIEQFIDSLREELNELWEKCHVPEVVQKEFNYSSSTVLNDEVLENYEAEVEKWKKYYEDVEHILKGIQKREELSHLKAVLEKKQTDPNRFKNRKGNLLQEEKQRKKIQKELPLLEAEIVNFIKEYEELSGCKFFYDGEDYTKLITNQWKEKSNEKTCKNLGVQMKPIFGTPGKRPPPTVPKSAPSKLLRSNAGLPLPRTPTAKPRKMLPNTVSKCIGQRHRDEAHDKKQKIALKESNQPGAVEMKSSPNGTTYTDFAQELNSPARHCLRSSVLATRRPSGSRISKNSFNSKKKIASWRSSKSSLINSADSNNSNE